MKVIYVAGPYRSATIHGTLENIRRAEQLAIDVWKVGFVAFCPHMNSAFFDGLVPDKTFLTGTLEMLSRCDALVLTKEWHNSEGTKAEVTYCLDHRIPVFYDIHELIRWRDTGCGYVAKEKEKEKERETSKIDAVATTNGHLPYE